MKLERDDWDEIVESLYPSTEPEDLGLPGVSRTVTEKIGEVLSFSPAPIELVSHWLDEVGGVCIALKDHVDFLARVESEKRDE